MENSKDRINSLKRDIREYMRLTAVIDWAIEDPDMMTEEEFDDYLDEAHCQQNALVKSVMALIGVDEKTAFWMVVTKLEDIVMLLARTA